MNTYTETRWEDFEKGFEGEWFDLIPGHEVECFHVYKTLRGMKKSANAQFNLPHENIEIRWAKTEGGIEAVWTQH